MGKSPESIKRMQGEVADQLSTFADLIGESDESKKSLYGFVPGVGLKTEADIVRNKSEEIRQGVFNVLFTGVFNGGKSTLINALIGKEMLKTAAKAETATISRIMFGRDEEKVTVFYNDKHPKGVHTEKITIEEYKKNYRLENGELDIDTIDHVEIEESENKFNNLAQFIDSLGLDSTAKESEITKVYEPKASAIVFLINGTSPCTVNEQDRIAVKYYNKHLKNVFFVITRMDCLGSEQAVKDVKERTQNILHDVFTDENNRFDEELFKKRVFYVNAQGAVNARTNQTNTIYVAGKYVKVEIDIDETGIPEFEKALEEFLLSDDKYKESYKGELDKLSSYFEEYERKSANILNLLQKDINAVLAAKKEDEANIEEVEKLISQIKVQCNDFVKSASTTATMEYTNFVNNVRAGWDSYFEAEAANIKFGFFDVAKIAGLNVKYKFNKDQAAYDREVQSLLKPISDAIFTQRVVKGKTETGGYIGKKLEDFKNGLSRKISEEMTETLKSIADLCDEVASVELGNTNMENVLKQVIINVRGCTEFGNGGSMAQALAMIILTGDYDTAIMTMTNKMSMGDLIKKVVITTIVEYIIAAIVMSLTGIGLIYYVIRAVWGFISVSKGGNKVVKEALAGAKDTVCNELSGQTNKIMAEINTSLEDSITKTSKQFTDVITSKLNDHKRELDDVANKLAKGDIDMAGEKERLDSIRAKMVEAFNDISKAIGGRNDYTLDKILDDYAKAKRLG